MLRCPRPAAAGTRTLRRHPPSHTTPAGPAPASGISQLSELEPTLHQGHSCPVTFYPYMDDYCCYMYTLLHLFGQQVLWVLHVLISMVATSVLTSSCAQHPVDFVIIAINCRKAYTIWHFPLHTVCVFLPLWTFVALKRIHECNFNFTFKINFTLMGVCSVEEYPRVQFSLSM